MKRMIGMMFLMFHLAHGANLAVGESKSSTCVACHGASGVSPNPLWPNLAGQKAGYLMKQIKAFRNGTRVDPMMSPVAKTLSDQDIDDLTAYFSKLKADGDH